MKHKKIAVIGAGLSGATVTNRLLQAGYQVTIYEKGRAAGGRLSSCRIGKDSADLGAPWFEPTTDQFRQWLAARPEVIRWKAAHSNFSGTALNPKSVYLAAPRQSALIQNLIKGAMIHTDANITGLYTDSFGLRLRRDNEKIKSLYDAVIITTPAPQAAALLKGSPHLRHIAKSTSTTPTWVAVISLKEKSGITPDILSGQNSTLYRATRDSSKPGKNSWSRKEVWVLEANTEWSERYKDSDQTIVGRALVHAFETLTKQPMDISSIKVRQWLHSHHQPITNEKYLWDQDNNVGVCSDWLYHQGAEGAWLSANALADQLLYCTRVNTFAPYKMWFFPDQEKRSSIPVGVIPCFKRGSHQPDLKWFLLEPKLTGPLSYY